MEKDLIGERFGKLVVIIECDRPYDGRMRFLCKCDCGNCRWATMKEQANNVSYNLVYEYNGESKTLKQLSDIVGINYHTLYGRIKRGWDIEKALEVKK